VVLSKATSCTGIGYARPTRVRERRSERSAPPHAWAGTLTEWMVPLSYFFSKNGTKSPLAPL